MPSRSRHRHLHALKRSPEREKPISSGTVLLLDRPVDSITRPDQAAERAEEKDWLRIAMLLLDPADQEVLEMHMDNHTDQEIGTRLEIKENAARVRRQRATGRLAQVVLRLKNGRITDAISTAEFGQ